MTDNYNDDYREVIPKEEKTETDVSETQDNEKNNGNTALRRCGNRGFWLAVIATNQNLRFCLCCC